MPPYSLPLSRFIGPDRTEVIHRIRLVAGQMEPAVQALIRRSLFQVGVRSLLLEIPETTFLIPWFARPM